MNSYLHRLSHTNLFIFPAEYQASGRIKSLLLSTLRLSMPLGKPFISFKISTARGHKYPIELTFLEYFSDEKYF